MELPKVKAELLASRMKQSKYLDEGVKITLYLYRQKNPEEFFTMEGTVVACKDVGGLFKALNVSHCSDEWRLFIDSAKVSPKAVLLQDGNVLPSVPVAHAFESKESDDSTKQLLQYIKHDTYKWNTVIALFCLECRSGTLNFLVSCVSGTAETKHITMSKGYDLPEKCCSQDTKCKALFTG